MRIRTLVAAAVAAGIVALAVFAIQTKYNHDIVTAKDDFREKAAQSALLAAGRLDQAFKEIYQGLRTISYLPSVRKIDRHGETLGDEGRLSIQQIYNNLKSNVAVSEVYVVPVSLDPEKTDPTTGKPEAPILMFDKLNFSDKAEAGSDEPEDPNAPEQVEIYEYRLLKDQMEYLQAKFPTRASIDGINAPMITGRECITCDNDDFVKTRNDADRMGVVLSVPFYDPEGKLAGTVSAIVRTVKLQDLLPEHDAALINMQYGYAAPARLAGQQTASQRFVQSGSPDPGLIFSQVLALDVNDPLSHWQMWAGRPDDAFWSSADVRSIENFRLTSLAALSFAVLIGLAILLVTRRNARIAQAHKAEMDHEEAVRRQDAERAREEREQMSRDAQERRRAEMMQLADQFEKTVGAIAQVVLQETDGLRKASQMLTSSAEKTKTQAVVAAHASGEAAKNSATVAAASDQLSHSVEEIQTQVHQSATITEQAVTKAGMMHAQIKDLAESTSVIGSIALLIEDIASKTNLLALNASIEAARAGDAGKTFTVVATEIKHLADQTARAMEDITRRVEAIRSSTGATATAIDDITTTIRQISEISAVIELAVREQNEATLAIAAAIRHVHDGSNEASQTIRSVEEDAVSSHSAASTALVATEGLGHQAEALMKEMNHFLHNVRAA